MKNGLSTSLFFRGDFCLWCRELCENLGGWNKIFRSQNALLRYCDGAGNLNSSSLFSSDQ